jgi:hypothetical protein
MSINKIRGIFFYLFETPEKIFFYYSDGGIFCNLQMFSPQKAQKTQKIPPFFVLFVPFVAEIIPWDYSEVSIYK